MIEYLNGYRNFKIDGIVKKSKNCYLRNVLSVKCYYEIGDVRSERA